MFSLLFILSIFTNYTSSMEIGFNGIGFEGIFNEKNPRFYEIGFEEEEKLKKEINDIFQQNSKSKVTKKINKIIKNNSQTKYRIVDTINILLQESFTEKHFKYISKIFKNDYFNSIDNDEQINFFFKFFKKIPGDLYTKDYELFSFARRYLKEDVIVEIINKCIEENYFDCVEYMVSAKKNLLKKVNTIGFLENYINYETKVCPCNICNFFKESLSKTTKEGGYNLALRILKKAADNNKGYLFKNFLKNIKNDIANYSVLAHKLDEIVIEALEKKFNKIYDLDLCGFFCEFKKYLSKENLNKYSKKISRNTIKNIKKGSPYAGKHYKKLNEEIKNLFIVIKNYELPEILKSELKEVLKNNINYGINNAKNSEEEYYNKSDFINLSLTFINFLENEERTEFLKSIFEKCMNLKLTSKLYEFTMIASKFFEDSEIVYFSNKFIETYIEKIKKKYFDSRKSKRFIKVLTLLKKSPNIFKEKVETIIQLLLQCDVSLYDVIKFIKLTEDQLNYDIEFSKKIGEHCLNIFQECIDKREWSELISITEFLPKVNIQKDILQEKLQNAIIVSYQNHAFSATYNLLKKTIDIIPIEIINSHINVMFEEIIASNITGAAQHFVAPILLLQQEDRRIEIDNDLFLRANTFVINNDNKFNSWIGGNEDIMVTGDAVNYVSQYLNKNNNEYCPLVKIEDVEGWFEELKPSIQIDTQNEMKKAIIRLRECWSDLNGALPKYFTSITNNNLYWLSEYSDFNSRKEYLLMSLIDIIGGKAHLDFGSCGAGVHNRVALSIGYMLTQYHKIVEKRMALSSGLFSHEKSIEEINLGKFKAKICEIGKSIFEKITNKEFLNEKDVNNSASELMNSAVKEFQINNEKADEVISSTMNYLMDCFRETNEEQNKEKNQPKQDIEIEKTKQCPEIEQTKQNMENRAARMIRETKKIMKDLSKKKLSPIENFKLGDNVENLPEGITLSKQSVIDGIKNENEIRAIAENAYEKCFPDQIFQNKYIVEEIVEAIKLFLNDCEFVTKKIVHTSRIQKTKYEYKEFMNSKN